MMKLELMESYGTKFQIVGTILNESYVTSIELFEFTDPTIIDPIFDALENTKIGIDTIGSIEGVYLAGGMLRDILSGAPESARRDFDFFFASEKAMNEFKTFALKSERRYLKVDKPERVLISNIAGDIDLSRRDYYPDMYSLLLDFDMDICMHALDLHNRVLLTSLVFIDTTNTKSRMVHLSPVPEISLLDTFIHYNRLLERFNIRIPLEEMLYLSRGLSTEMVVRGLSNMNVMAMERRS